MPQPYDIEATAIHSRERVQSSQVVHPPSFVCFVFDIWLTPVSELRCFNMQDFKNMNCILLHLRHCEIPVTIMVVVAE